MPSLQTDGAAPVAPASRYPAVSALLAHRRWIVNGSAAAVCAAAFWAGWRTGLPEWYLAGPLLGAALHFTLRVAIEVVGRVAETLMPQ